ncbi:glycosyltransferase [Saliterribacillus persicus]|uniref:Glycosyltransferase involved in cell wall biosynthesis n=1 Tax=Saliterribacillus persicus TaxID=930114 RepID=A0A368YD54_9BACI|nr:glycosyltransferase [Saliterribacillus persicus]RCW77368.1 glycosyltransferase involved in cell wall biosynthesis [Saliterribacillus persicus]
MKKILFVLNNTNIGGPQKSLLAILDNIDYSKFDVSLLVLNSKGILQKYINPKTKVLTTDPLITAATIPVNQTVKYLGILLKNGNVRMCLSAIFSIIKHLTLRTNMNQERQKFWMKYHSQLPVLTDKYDMAFGVSAGLTTYFVVDCVSANRKFHWVRSDYRILGLSKEIEEKYFRQVDGSLAVSQQCADIFINEFPFMRGKLNVLYNYIPLTYYDNIGYDASLMPNDQAYKTILTVCRLDPLKGIDMAIDACEKLISKGKRIKWYILGGGQEKTNIESMIKNRGLEDSFILLGFQSNTLAYIQQCDIFVHPSRTEGKSNAVDEAKYVGKPIIVTNYDTVKEQIENEVTGLVCSMSGQDIAEAIEKLLDDDTLCAKLSDNCKDHMDNAYNLNDYLIRLLN